MSSGPAWIGVRRLPLTPPRAGGFGLPQKASLQRGNLSSSGSLCTKGLDEHRFPLIAESLVGLVLQ